MAISALRERIGIKGQVLQAMTSFIFGPLTYRVAVDGTWPLVFRYSSEYTRTLRSILKEKKSLSRRKDTIECVISLSHMDTL